MTSPFNISKPPLIYSLPLGWDVDAPGHTLICLPQPSSQQELDTVLFWGLVGGNGNGMWGGRPG